ncbi:hypothetical protein GCM10023238_26350 [Streptomyces heliomycini]
MVDADAKKITVKSAEAEKAYGTWLDLFDGKGLHKADVTADAYTHIQDAFVNGKVASIIQGPWEITNFYKGTAFKDKNNLGIATVPAGSAGTAGAPTGGHNLSVYAGSTKDKQEAALKFVKFMTSAKAQETIALKNSTLPTRDDAYTDKVKTDPGIAGYQTVLSAAQPRPALPEYSSLWGPLGRRAPADRERQGVPGQGPGRRGDRVRQAGAGLQQVMPVWPPDPLPGGEGPAAAGLCAVLLDHPEGAEP